MNEIQLNFLSISCGQKSAFIWWSYQADRPLVIDIFCRFGKVKWHHTAKMTETKTQSKKSVGQKIIPKRKLSKRGQGKDSVKSKYQPLDGQWGWMIVLGASLGHFFLVGLARTMGVFFVYWVDRFEGTAAATAWVQSLFNTVRMVIGKSLSDHCFLYINKILYDVFLVLTHSSCFKLVLLNIFEIIKKLNVY